MISTPELIEVKHALSSFCCGVESNYYDVNVLAYYRSTTNYTITSSYFHQQKNHALR